MCHVELLQDMITVEYMTTYLYNLQKIRFAYSVILQLCYSIFCILQTPKFHHHTPYEQTNPLLGKLCLTGLSYN